MHVNKSYRGRDNGGPLATAAVVGSLLMPQAAE